MIYGILQAPPKITSMMNFLAEKGSLELELEKIKHRYFSHSHE